MAALVDRGAPSCRRPVAGSWRSGPDGPLAYSLTTLPRGIADVELSGLAGLVAAVVRALPAHPSTGVGRATGTPTGGRRLTPSGSMVPASGRSVGRPLAAHPALVGRPALRPGSSVTRRPSRRRWRDRPLVLVHSDLHEENMLSDGDRLAFIDFGETFVGAAAWEFASIAYFTSWDARRRRPRRFAADDPAMRRAWRATVALLALSFGLCPLGAGHRHGARHRRLQRGVPAPDPRAHRDCYHRADGDHGRPDPHDRARQRGRRCDGCLEIIDGTPVAGEPARHRRRAKSPVAWTERPTINPGPFQFHGEPACVRRWMADKGYLFCRRGEVREIMRPIADPRRDGPLGPVRRHPPRRSRVRPGLTPAARRGRRDRLTRAERRAYPPPARPLRPIPRFT